MNMIREEDKTHLTISGDFTICNVASIREGIIEALGQSEQVDIDLTDVSAVDLAGLQLLCSAHRSAMETGKVLAIVGMQTPPVQKARGAAGFIFNRGCRFCQSAECLWVGGIEK